MSRRKYLPARTYYYLVGSLVQLADVRAVKRRHAPTKEDIHADFQPLIDAFQSSLAAAPDAVPSPRYPLFLYGFPESTKTILNQTVFPKWLRDALREGEFRTRFNPDAPVALSKDLPDEYWALLYTRRPLLAIPRSGANAVLYTKPDDSPFCSRDM